MGEYIYFILFTCCKQRLGGLYRIRAAYVQRLKTPGKAEAVAIPAPLVEGQKPHVKHVEKILWYVCKAVSHKVALNAEKHLYLIGILCLQPVHFPAEVVQFSAPYAEEHVSRAVLAYRHSLEPTRNSGKDILLGSSLAVAV